MRGLETRGYSRDPGDGAHDGYARHSDGERPVEAGVGGPRSTCDPLIALGPPDEQGHPEAGRSESVQPSRGVPQRCAGAHDEEPRSGLEPTVEECLGHPESGGHRGHHGPEREESKRQRGIRRHDDGGEPAPDAEPQQGDAQDWGGEQDGERLQQLVATGRAFLSRLAHLLALCSIVPAHPSVRGGPADEVDPGSGGLEQPEPAYAPARSQTNAPIRRPKTTITTASAIA